MALSQGLRTIMASAALVLAACSQPADKIDPQGKVFDAVAPDEVISLIGTEPFWGIRITGGQASYSHPEHPEGLDFAVTRFAGNNGLGFSGTLDGQAVAITLTPGECSDGMSDLAYPFVATVAYGEATLRGCGYTDRQKFTGAPEQ
jgi:uncharacterized membrane protein